MLIACLNIQKGKLSQDVMAQRFKVGASQNRSRLPSAGGYRGLQLLFWPLDRCSWDTWLLWSGTSSCHTEINAYKHKVKWSRRLRSQWKCRYSQSWNSAFIWKRKEKKKKTANWFTSYSDDALKRRFLLLLKERILLLIWKVTEWYNETNLNHK